MSVAPRGMSVSEAYRLYSEGRFIINRRYQRKLVWTEEEKSKLIDSMLSDYPIPLILLAQIAQRDDSPVYEVIDGMQRLNAIFSFIENSFSLDDGSYFDVKELARAKQAVDKGIIEKIPPSSPLISPEKCADIIDYQLAVTIFVGSSKEDIDDIFGRINSQGRQLSRQEVRQAGNVSAFANVVREIAAEIRGDVSTRKLKLNEMPSISVGYKGSKQSYGIQANDTFWCKHGVLRASELRDSEDEQMIADIVASIVLKDPIRRDPDNYNRLYDNSSELHCKVNDRVIRYNSESIKSQVVQTFSIIQALVDESDGKHKSLRRILVKKNTSNPIKTPFYSLFMAVFNFVFVKEKTYTSASDVVSCLSGCSTKLHTASRTLTVEKRLSNIRTIQGLVNHLFVGCDKPMFTHGSNLIIEFENSIRRSSVETSRYEFKQGVCSLDSHRKLQSKMFAKIAKEACAIANIGPESTGYIFIGVADDESDAQRIENLDNITPVTIGSVSVVGIDREATAIGISLEDLIQKINSGIRKTKLSEHLLTDMMSHVDLVTYQGLSVLRYTIPPQKRVSWLGDELYIKQGSNSVLASGKQISIVTESFARTST